MHTFLLALRLRWGAEDATGVVVVKPALDIHLCCGAQTGRLRKRTAAF